MTVRAEKIRLIVNADDLGLRPSVNEAIFSLMESQTIRSATIMANGPAFEQAASQIKKFRHCSFGVHLNCTSFAPLGPNKAVKSVLGEDGNFRRYFREASPTPALLLGLLEEFSLQIRRIEQFGVSVSHIDSHHHVHTEPALFPVLKCLQIRHRIRRVRITRNIFEHDERSAHAKRLKKRAFNRLLRMVYATKTADYFGSFAAFLRDGAIPARSCVIEAMVHPGQETNDEFRDEENLLKTNWQESYPMPIEIIDYRQL